MAQSFPGPQRKLNISGLWVAVFIFVLVSSCELFHLIKHSSRLDAIAREIGGLGYVVKNEGVWKNGKMELNHQGTQIIFCQSSEKGMGVFLANVSDGNKKTIFEEKEMCF